MNIQKCGIIGCGGVGATTAYTLVESGLFNEMVLIDIDKKKAEGEALDIGHGIPFTVPSDIYAGDYPDLKDAYLVVVTAGANQLPGETRLDISAKNAEVFRKIIPNIVKYNTECILLIVTNPVDVLTSLSLQLSGFPASRVIGSGTVLDTARLKYLLGKKFNLDYRNIHAWMIGEHGDSELAAWSSATVAGLPVDEYCRQHGRTRASLQLNEIYEEVRDSAYEIIERKGSTFYAVAMAVRRIAQALVRDEHSILTISSLAQGHYGIQQICIGLPAVLGRHGVEDIIEIPLNPGEKEMLHESAGALKKIYDQIKGD
ncbi:L-lactate dehydrogenase [Luxibacter massiliensis]|uniref:L-lactate dehydrogenase n=1 Tax=Luxibacter massiliensis TaxID=2219695 RepID=UPI0027B8FA4B|nr:L-lactate dehydrogenase [Luxibacter massiliensis]